MEMEEHLKRIQKKFYEYDFTDSIIEDLCFDKDLVNFCIFVDYFFTEEDEEHIQLIFEKCTKVDYEIPQDIYTMNNDELNVSHFTITKILVNVIGDQVCIKIFTFNNESEFLKVICKNVKFERISKTG